MNLLPTKVTLDRPRDWARPIWDYRFPCCFEITSNVRLLSVEVIHECGAKSYFLLWLCHIALGTYRSQLSKSDLTCWTSAWFQGAKQASLTSRLQALFWDVWSAWPVVLRFQKSSHHVSWVMTLWHGTSFESLSCGKGRDIWCNRRQILICDLPAPRWGRDWESPGCSPRGGPAWCRTFRTALMMHVNNIVRISDLNLDTSLVHTTKQATDPFIWCSYFMMCINASSSCSWTHLNINSPHLRLRLV